MTKTAGAVLSLLRNGTQLAAHYAGRRSRDELRRRAFLKDASASLSEARQRLEAGLERELGPEEHSTRVGFEGSLKELRERPCYDARPAGTRWDDDDRPLPVGFPIRRPRDDVPILRNPKWKQAGEVRSIACGIFDPPTLRELLQEVMGSSAEGFLPRGSHRRLARDVEEKQPETTAEAVG
jgi:hypothetical protein